MDVNVVSKTRTTGIKLEYPKGCGCALGLATEPTSRG